MPRNLHDANREWAVRPNDERYWGLDDMGAALQDARARSDEVATRVSHVRAVVGGDGASLCLTDGRDPMDLTHWSMGQLSTYADAPASYLRTLPPELAAACINQGLSRYHGEDVQLMTQRGDNGPTMRAMTTTYSRLWNADIVRALTPATEHGWMTPRPAPFATTRVPDPPPSRTSCPVKTGSGCPSRWAIISPLLDVMRPIGTCLSSS